MREDFIQYLPLEEDIKLLTWEDRVMREFPHGKRANGERPIEATLPSMAEAFEVLGYDSDFAWREVRTDINRLAYEYLAGISNTALADRVKIFNAYFRLYYQLYASQTDVFPHSSHPYCLRRDRSEHIATLYANYILGRATANQIRFIEDVKQYGVSDEEVYAKVSEIKMLEMNRILRNRLSLESALQILGLREDDILSKTEYYNLHTTRKQDIFRDIHRLKSSILQRQASGVSKEEILHALISLSIHYHKRCKGTGIRFIGESVTHCSCMGKYRTFQSLLKLVG